MTEPNTPQSPTRARTRWWAAGLAALGAAAAGLACAGRSGGEPTSITPDMPHDPPAGSQVFTDWPKDVKPDAVIVLSGETFGFLQPCGCSRPQFGGLERRANLINGLKAKGWPVVGVDLGDLYPQRVMVPEQSRMKYATAMASLREMGYVAVGVGKTEFSAGVLNAIAEYSLQKEQPPFVLAGNLLGKADGKLIPRDQFFPAPQPGGRPLVGLAEVADVGGVPVGVVGVIGKSVSEDGRKADQLLEFADTQETLKQGVAALAAHPRKPVLNVLIFQDTAENARAAARDRPEFQIVLCKSDADEPPQFPEVVDQGGGRKALLIQVGHKGRYVGLVGAFKKAGGGFDLKYQLVALGEEYLTPDNPAAEKAQPVLPLLEEYARQVKDRHLLEKAPKVPHPAQIQAPDLNLSYIGSERCAACHAGELAKWKETPHSHAMEALEKIARRPGLRNFDAECVVCHAVGLGYKTGFETAEKTPHLKHVGCENCHGPGSGHASAPTNAELLKLMSPWKQDKTDRLPDAATMDKLAKLSPIDRGSVAIPVPQQRTINAVTTACMKCHDGENDPHFDLFKYWPKIIHGPPPKK